ncbi:MAG: hypothetical protein CVU07_01345 [Bacteroidetes bacterium HGW-Bacteroidetes-23]|nr:MAG: hypothetical protein CVU07_01345 [Bacteroidetes bacterium HGW-Bacteroidetes-23]
MTIVIICQSQKIKSLKPADLFYYIFFFYICPIMKNTNQHRNSILSIESDRLFGKNPDKFMGRGVCFEEKLN